MSDARAVAEKHGTGMVASILFCALAVLGILFSPFPAHAASDGIPAPFRGTWDLDASACKGDGTDGRHRISTKEIRLYEAICKLKKVARATQTSFRGSFVCSGEGVTEQRQISRGIRNGVLVDSDNTTLVRCER
jgi:hypothetical protein